MEPGWPPSRTGTHTGLLASPQVQVSPGNREVVQGQELWGQVAQAGAATCWAPVSPCSAGLDGLLFSGTLRRAQVRETLRKSLTSSSTSWEVPEGRFQLDLCPCSSGTCLARL